MALEWPQFGRSKAAINKSFFAKKEVLCYLFSMRSRIIFALLALALRPTLAFADGKTLFNTNCAICHLASGQGGIHFGDAVSANLTAPGLEQTFHHSDALIARAILHARDETGAPLDLPMPAWAGRLTNSEVAEIIAYLHKLKS